ncbi:MAG: NAD(P)/FAD-dependent oxidoreductase [Clostridia bacterium]|nr:NAD(P)/FAD-dependent oxidoreductase [Clostridia bacterium]
MYDVIILGGGPAGVSASLYCARANKKVLLIYGDDSGLMKAQKIDNYYGFENGISGEELYRVGLRQAKNIGVEILEEEVLKIEMNEHFYEVSTKNRIYETRTIILAMGTKRNTLKIQGIQEFEGKGVSYCAICDGFFYKNKDVVVIGSGDYAISETNDLINVVNRITILTNGEKAPEVRSDNVAIVTKEVKEVLGEGRVEEIRFKDNSTLKTDGVFIANGTAGATEFAKKLGLMMNNDKIAVDENMKTNIEGIYACGDCTGGLLQVSKAVYEGAKAGLAVIEYLNFI